jgi:hypothetical protein
MNIVSFLILKKLGSDVSKYQIVSFEIINAAFSFLGFQVPFKEVLH